MRNLLIILSTAMILQATTAYGKEDNLLSAKFSACMDKSEGVTVNMLDCIGDENKRQDDELNKAYKNVMKELTPIRQKELKEAQRLWIKYRDANCNFYADPDGGTLARVVSADCFMNATAQRARELKNLQHE